MIVDPRLQKQVDQHPYPLVFATISGAHLYGFHQREYERLSAELEQTFQQSQLPESSSAQSALNDMLVRLRLRGISDIN